HRYLISFPTRRSSVLRTLLFVSRCRMLALEPVGEAGKNRLEWAFDLREAAVAGDDMFGEVVAGDFVTDEGNGVAVALWNRGGDAENALQLGRAHELADLFHRCRQRNAVAELLVEINQTTEERAVQRFAAAEIKRDAG